MTTPNNTVAGLPEKWREMAEKVDQRHQPTVEDMYERDALLFCANDLKAALASPAPSAGVEWRWVDGQGRAMTKWSASDPPPMEGVSDDKGYMRVETRPASMRAVLDLIGEYWCLAYAEGKEGRTHDTEDGAAQRKLSEIKGAIRRLATAEQPDEARCAECDARLELVRPGKHQHPTCGQAEQPGSAVQGEVEYEFEVWQDDSMQAGGSTTDYATAKGEADHYALMYGQDGPVEVRMYEKRRITTPPPAPAAEGVCLCRSGTYKMEPGCKHCEPAPHPWVRGVEGMVPAISPNGSDDDMLAYLDKLLTVQGQLMFARENYDEEAAETFGVAILDFMRLYGMRLRAKLAAHAAEVEALKESLDGKRHEANAAWVAAEAAERDASAKQARIDALMLKYCPDEMTPEQVADWSQHQAIAATEQAGERENGTEV